MLLLLPVYVSTIRLWISLAARLNCYVYTLVYIHVRILWCETTECLGFGLWVCYSEVVCTDSVAEVENDVSVGYRERNRVSARDV